MTLADVCALRPGTRLRIVECNGAAVPRALQGRTVESVYAEELVMRAADGRRMWLRVADASAFRALADGFALAEGNTVVVRYVLVGASS